MQDDPFFLCLHNSSIRHSIPPKTWVPSSMRTRLISHSLDTLINCSFHLCLWVINIFFVLVQFPGPCLVCRNVSFVIPACFLPRVAGLYQLFLQCLNPGQVHLRSSSILLFSKCWPPSILLFRDMWPLPL